MTTEAPPLATLGDSILEKLRASPHPLTLKEASKGVPKLKKEKPAELEARVRAALEAEVAPARVFLQPSGKGGATRFWARDEQHLLRERAVELAAKPQALAALTKAVANETKADPGFVEGLLRDLIRDELLHEHPAKKGPLFGASPPPPPIPPLEQPAGAKELAKVVKAVEGAMKKVKVSAAEVLAALAKHYAAPAVTAPEASPPPAMVPFHATEAPALDAVEIERLVLDAVEREGTMSLKELRRQMPAGGQTSAFDRAVLGLEERGRVSLSRDYDASHFGPEEQAEYVREGDFLYTSIAKRS
jgi:hypothetical protein